MPTICFVSYEIHPTTWGGCGVLLRHAAELLLRDGHDVIFLLDIPESYFRTFDAKDRLTFTNADRCRAYHVDTLCADLTLAPESVGGMEILKSLRFAHALAKVRELEPALDFVEFFEYCGVGYHAMVRRLFGRDAAHTDGTPVLGVRLHNSIELIDQFGATRHLDRQRYTLYALERATMRLSEAVLAPTRAFFDAYYRDRYAIAPERVAISQSPKTGFPRVRSRPDPAGPFTITYVGRMFQFKNVDQLVRAAVELLRRRPALPCTIEVMGPDASESPFGSSYIGYLRSLIPVAMRDRFVFTGHLAHDAIADRLAHALFAVFPNRFESFCYALHEVYDAGVPVIINDLPGFRDFFTHERNCLVYDGGTDTLLAAMERMLDDTPLRDRLTRPYPVATDPLGTFYTKPRPLAPLCAGAAKSPSVLALVAATGEFDSATTTLRALRDQSTPPTETVVLVPSNPDDEATFWFLGRPWHARDAQARPLAPASVLTRDAIVLLRAGDIPDPRWLDACTCALRSRPTLGFAGTWARHAGSLIAQHLDLSPETYPFEHGSMPTRVLVRTAPSRPLLDLFEPGLGPLGDIGNVWSAVARVGHGAVLPEALIELGSARPEHADPHLLKYLVSRLGQPFADRLRVYATLLHDHARAHAPVSPAPGPHAAPAAPPHAEPSLELKIRHADELGGSLLARMAAKKLARRLRGKPPARP